MLTEQRTSSLKWWGNVHGPQRFIRPIASQYSANVIIVKNGLANARLHTQPTMQPTVWFKTGHMIQESRPDMCLRSFLLASSRLMVFVPLRAISTLIIGRSRPVRASSKDH